MLKDGRKDLDEIAEENDVSKSFICKHYTEMKKAGIIIGATAQVNYAHLGYSAVAEIISPDYFGNLLKIQEQFQKIPEIIFSFYEPLQSCLVAIARLRNLDTMDEFRERIRQAGTIGRTLFYFWTGKIRNIPENLSFGLPAWKNQVNEAQSKSTIDPVQVVKECDAVDLQIIDKLFRNGRLSFRKIAQDIGVTTDTVARRYKRLKKNGTVNVAIQICPQRIGYHCCLDSFLVLKSQKNIDATINALSMIPDVFCIVGTSGGYDLHVWSLVMDIDHLFSIQNRISKVPEFGKMDYRINSGFIETYPSPNQYITTT